MGTDLVHFDIPADDPTGLAEFYREALGWTVEAPMPGYDNYMLIETGEGAVGGGMHKRETRDERPVNYYLVDDIEEYNSRVVRSGGQVLVEHVEVPGFGEMSVCLDPDGNSFGLWKAAGEPGLPER